MSDGFSFLDGGYNITQAAVDPRGLDGASILVVADAGIGLPYPTQRILLHDQSKRKDAA